MRCLSAPASKFSTSSRSGLPQFACFRTATLCNPLLINDFHTLQKCPFATPVFSMGSTLFEKQRGGYTPKGEAPAKLLPKVGRRFQPGAASLLFVGGRGMPLVAPEAGARAVGI